MFCIKPFEISAFGFGGSHKRKPKAYNKEEGGNFTPPDEFSGNFLHLQTSIREEKKKNPC